MAEEVCARCGGIGYVIIERDGLSAAERCECAFRRQAESLVRHSGVPAGYARATFDNFDTRGSSELSGAITLAHTYCREYPNVTPPGLLFIGDTGTGKTHLAVAMLHRLIENGFEGLFVDYQNLLDRIRAGYDPLSGESPREAYEMALDAEILLLDDLGAHRVTDWVEDTVTSIITYRCNEQKPIIATTNMPDPDMGGTLIERLPQGAPAQFDVKKSLAEKIGMRARSRLFEMCRIIRMPKIDDFRVATRR